MTTKLPEIVYLVTMDTEWPVSAIADCHPSTVETVATEVARRGGSPGSLARSTLHVWRARLADITEMELTPARSLPPELTEKRTEVADR